MISFGNDELENKPDVHVGEKVRHEKCGKFHTLLPATGQDGKEDTSLLYVVCNGAPYLAAIDNKLILE